MIVGRVRGRVNTTAVNLLFGLIEFLLRLREKVGMRRRKQHPHLYPLPSRERMKSSIKDIAER